ncbi:MAG: OmpA family protein [Bacteroidales bacterium]|nr:OmpA family protein [Bacteroidales bacterium]
MKKSFFAIACALFLGQSMVAQNENVAVLVEDPSQGVLENRFRDNWFLGIEGGVSALNNREGHNVDFKDRIAPDVQLSVGKWFSPKWGVRANLEWFQSKAEYKMNNFSASVDGLLNLTNWWCGYNPTRVYNASLYAGAGVAVRYAKNGAGDWKDVNNNIIVGRVGLLNTFRLSDHWQFLIDLRIIGSDKSLIDYTNNGQSYGGQVLIGFNYNFGKSTWSAPVVPVFVEPENCDALRARLQAADARIADLEAQLKACLERPVQTVVAAPEAPLATIYFPINSYTLNRSDRNVLGAIADIMKSNPNQKYVLTGYADNYTGTDAYNVKLRHNRANSVQKQLVRNGVPASQLEATINNGNLCDLGAKYVALDRCVTINEK